MSSNLSPDWLFYVFFSVVVIFVAFVLIKRNQLEESREANQLLNKSNKR